MSSYQISLVLGVLCAVISQVMSQQSYLPPNKGYDYKPPLVPFPGTIRTTKIPYTTSRPVVYSTPRPVYTTPRPVYTTPAPHVHHDDHHDHHHHEPGMPFDFNYAVKDAEYGNDYSHNAVSDGDVTRGEYRIQLPDGRLQIVRYTADWKNGFNAEVSYEGQAQYPDTPQGGNFNFQAPQGGYKY